MLADANAYSFLLLDGTYTIPQVPAGGSAVWTLPVSGVLPGDSIVGFPTYWDENEDLPLLSVVAGTDQVSVTLFNRSGAPIDPATDISLPFIVIRATGTIVSGVPFGGT